MAVGTDAFWELFMTDFEFNFNKQEAQALALEDKRIVLKSLFIKQQQLVESNTKLSVSLTTMARLCFQLPAVKGFEADNVYSATDKCHIR